MLLKESDSIKWQVLLDDLQKRRNLHSNWAQMKHNPPETQKVYAALAKEMQNLINTIPDYVKESKP